MMIGVATPGVADTDAIATHTATTASTAARSTPNLTTTA